MSNVLTNAIPKLLKYGALALRQNAILPRLVNTDNSGVASEKGNTIDVLVPFAKTAAAVTPGTAQAGDVKPIKYPITLDHWYQAGFAINAQEMTQIDATGVLVGDASEALKAVVNAVEVDMIAKMWKRTSGYAGAVNAVPDGIDDIVGCRKALNKNLILPSDRSLVVNSDVEANFLQLTAFTSAGDSGSAAAVVEGLLGRKFGFNIASDQNVDDIDCNDGTQDGAYLVDSAAVAIGDTSVNVDTGTGTFLEGAMFTVAGDTQVYVCTASELTGGNDKTLNFQPPAQVAWANDAAITFIADHDLGGLAFHRSFLSLVTRPVALSQAWGNVRLDSVTDPVSGLTLILKTEYKDWIEYFNWALLWGCAVTRPQAGVRLLSS